MDDDDWGLSFDELDSLERNAAAQLASRNRATSSSTAAAPILLDSGSPMKPVQNLTKCSSSSLLSAAAPTLLESESPKKKTRLDADVIHILTRNTNFGSPKSTDAGANAAICTSPTNDNFGSPQKKAGVVNRVLSQSPVKKSGRELKVKLFRDEPGRIAVESPYHPDLVPTLRSFSGKRWEQSRKVWTYPEGVLDDVVTAMRSHPSLQIAIDADPSLPVRDADPLIEQGAEDEGEIWSSPPQTTTLQGNQHWGGKISQSPQKLHLQPSEDVAQTSSKSAKFQGSQDDGSNRLPLKRCIVNLFLHSSGKIAAKFEYDGELVSTVKKIPKAEWNSKERLWMFPFSSLVESEKILSNVSCRSVRVEPLFPLVKRALEATAVLPDLQDRYDCIPEELRKTLMDFQVDGVRFALQRGGRALIADEMGLGKTLQALAVVSCLKDDWPVLIIVPSSLRLNWATMLEKWLHIDPSKITVVMSQGTSHEGFNIVRTTGKQKLLLEGVFNIVSYDVLAKLEDIIYLSDFQVVIADESHYMKNPTAKRTNVSVPFIQKAKYALLLTGTPALSRPIEMFKQRLDVGIGNYKDIHSDFNHLKKQLEAVQPSVYKRMDEYGKRYCMGGYFGVYQGSSYTDELHALLKSTVMIRRLKRDVMKQLPKKRREQVFISLEDKGARKLHELLKQLESAKQEHRLALARKNEEEAQNLNFEERQLLSQIYTETAEAKITAVQDYLTTMIEASCKFLVFAHHQCMLEGIQDLLQKKKVKFIRIDGKTPASSRQDLVKSFQEQPDVTVALLGIRAAGVGLTLTAASTVIFAEMSWTPGDLVQAEDRVHRIGQESAVNIYYLHAKRSIDDLIWDAVQHKLENLGQVLDGEGETSMTVASKSSEHGGSSIRQESLDPYMLPSLNPSVPIGNPTVRTHTAEVLTSSQGNSAIENFLCPFEMGKDASLVHRFPAHGAEVPSMPRTSLSSRGQGANYCGASWSQTPEHIDLDDDIAEEGDFGSDLVPDRYPPRKKLRRLS